MDKVNVRRSLYFNYQAQELESLLLVCVAVTLSQVFISSSGIEVSTTSVSQHNSETWATKKTTNKGQNNFLAIHKILFYNVDQVEVYSRWYELTDIFWDCIL